MIIYKATNLVNEKVYIGQTIRTLDYRRRGHEDPNEKNQMLIARAIRKYGKENFSWTQIDFATNQIDLDGKEIFWIRTYMSTNRNLGYNISGGGNGGINWFENHPDKEAIGKKMSNSAKNKPPITDEARKNLSIAISGSEKHKAVMASEEYRKNLSNSQLISEKFQKATRSKEKGENVSKAKKGVKQKLGTCIYCKRVLGLNMITKFHNEHCYMNPTIDKVVERKRRSDWVTDETKLNLSKKLKNKKKPTGICIHCNVEMDLSNLLRYHNEHCYENPNVNVEAEKLRRKFKIKNNVVTVN